MFSRFALALLIAGSGLAQQSSPAPAAEKLAPYYPTPQTIVSAMLDLAALKPGEKMFDLGSGDGRIVIMAAQRYRAQAVGVELDDDLAAQSEEKIRRLGLQDHAHIIHGDMLKQDYSSANVVTVYLLPESNLKVRPVLDPQLKRGTRIVAHDFEIGGWTPVKSVAIADDGEGRSHMLYLYIIK
jgi:protein-L-isoaspartate O-methyltransferase